MYVVMRSLFTAVLQCRFALAVSFCAVLFVPQLALAATLSLSPPAASVATGNIITLTAVVNSQGVAINNSEAVIQYPTDLLQVISVSRSSSIFKLWVEEPTFSNTLGQVSFNGGIVNPGFQGSQGHLVAITFRAVKAGTASVLFSDSTVRANDGLGTNVLSGKYGATLTITSLDDAVPAPTPTSGVTALKISSPTHPDQKAWYARSDVIVQWNLSQLVDTVQTAIDSSPNGVPYVTYTPAIARKEIVQVDDGVSYFHLRYRDTAGEWSKTSHFRIQIDTKNPYDLVVTTSADPDGELVIKMSAEDDLSGIGHYSVQIDDGKPLIVLADTATGEAVAKLSSMGGKEHDLVVKAFDRAGNAVETTRSLGAGAPPVININSYPTSIKVGQTINVTGQVSYGNADVSVALTIGGKRIETGKVVSNSSGAFSFESAVVKDPGIGIVWADLLNKNGDVIATSDRVTIAIKQPILISIGTYTAELLSIIIPLLALLLLLIALAYIGWHKFFGLRAQLRRDLDELKTRAHGTFKKLSDEMSDELNVLEHISNKGKKSAEAEKTLEDLRSAVGSVDEYIQKMIKKVEDVDL